MRESFFRYLNFDYVLKMMQITFPSEANMQKDIPFHCGNILFYGFLIVPA